MVELATFVQVLVMIGAPIALGRAIARRHPVGARPFVIGALAFVLSQVGHLPFNALVERWLPAPGSPWFLPVAAAFYGLSAACFEELARYGAMRFAMKSQHTGPHALAYGAGHGGIESIILGAMVGLTLVNVLVLERLGPDQAGLDASQTTLVREQLGAYHAAGVVPHLLGAMERLCTIPFHVAASTLVMRALVERRGRWLAAAIAYHAFGDGVLVPLVRYGLELSEVFVLAMLPVSLLTIAVSLRALPKLDREAREPRPPASGAPIEVVRAEKHYGDVHALRGASFTLKPGERACLLGPNGAGKTTTIRMITGAIAPSRGFVFVLGASSEDDAFLERKRRVGIVPQQPGMYEHTSVRDYLALVKELYAPADADDAVVERLGLDPFLDRKTHTLSGGTQRRLALAAALLPRPDVLVLDEPSAGLDPVASRQMIACVKDASAARTTLLCTHNLAEAEELCDSVIILREGRVVVHQSIEALRAQVTGRIALRALGEPAALVEALRARGHAPEIVDGEVLVPATGAERAAPELLRALLADGIGVYECRIVKPSLEDLFFRVVDGEAPPAEGGAS